MPIIIIVIIIIITIIIIIIIIYLPRLNTVHLSLQQHHLARRPQETVRLTIKATTDVNIFASEIRAAPLRLSQFRMILIKNSNNFFLKLEKLFKQVIVARREFKSFGPW